MEQKGFCFLCEQEPIWRDVLADALTDAGIPFAEQAAMGAGMALKAGPMLERIRFYVPEDRLEEAKELAASLLAAE